MTAAASVVVRTRDEADRLRLALTALSRQSVGVEVVVVDDGSRDHTPDVLRRAATELDLRTVTHDVSRGRCAASNAGARIASGDVLVFIDGDTLAAPDYVARHLEAHASGSFVIGRGEGFNIRSSRFLLDPQTATPRPGEEARIARLDPVERAALAVTREDVRDRFEVVARRGEPGVYPGAGPRRLNEIETDALRNHPACTVLWAACSGSNLSVRRDAFLDAGGFDDDIDNNEHRELALRLCERGASMRWAQGARDYHLTHRSGWRDPLLDTNWEHVFYRRHPLLVVKLLAVFWASLGPNRLPREAQIHSLPELEIAARGANGVDYDAARRLIGKLPELGVRAAATEPATSG